MGRGCKLCFFPAVSALEQSFPTKQPTTYGKRSYPTAVSARHNQMWCLGGCLGLARAPHPLTLLVSPGSLFLRHPPGVLPKEYAGLFGVKEMPLFAHDSRGRWKAGVLIVQSPGTPRPVVRGDGPGGGQRTLGCHNCT